MTKPNTITKETREKFGVTGEPLQGTRALAKELDASKFSGAAVAVIVFNDKDGSYVGANVYHFGTPQAKFGKGYDPANYGPYPIPGKDSEKWKKWRKDGYGEIALADLGDLVVDVSETVATETSEASEA